MVPPAESPGSSIRLRGKSSPRVYRSRFTMYADAVARESWPGKGFLSRALNLNLNSGLIVNSPQSGPEMRTSRGLGWRIHCGVEVTESSTNKQHTLSNPSGYGFKIKLECVECLFRRSPGQAPYGAQ
jgi:hypothetical protein